MASVASRRFLSLYFFFVSQQCSLILRFYKDFSSKFLKNRNFFSIEFIFIQNERKNIYSGAFLSFSPTWFGQKFKEMWNVNMTWMIFHDFRILLLQGGSMIMVFWLILHLKRKSTVKWKRKVLVKVSDNCHSKYIHLRWKPARTGTNFKWNISWLGYLSVYFLCGRHPFP